MDKTLAPLYHQLADLAAKYGAQKLVLFGSRARGDNTPRSDIDLAVYGMPKQNQSLFWSDAMTWQPCSSWTLSTSPQS